MEATKKPTVTVFGAAGEADLPGLERIRDLANPRFANDEAGLAALMPDTDVLLGWDFRAAVLERVWAGAQRLQWVHWAGAGVDAALFPALRDSSVILTNARGVFDPFIAEYVLGLVLCFAKDFPGTVHRQAARQWEFRYTEPIAGRTALVVGTGSIGSAIGRLLKAAGMQVTGVARSARGDDPVFGAVAPMEALDARLGEADYVINVTPSTPQTRGLFSAARFGHMKAGSRFINVGRGDAVDEPALLEALHRGPLAGAALDVFAAEPLPAASPLWQRDDVIVSPHMSGDVRGSQAHLAEQFTDNLQRFLAGEPLRNVVDKQRGY